MPFPLPAGCRKVCRPVRDPPRTSRIDVVVRMAVAAVKHGEDACYLSQAVASAVGCQPCAPEVEELSISVELLDQSVGDLLSALIDLAGLFGVPKGGLIPDPSLWDIFVQFFKDLAKIYRVISAIADVLENGWLVIDYAFSVIMGARALIQCLNRQNI
jgi:hypothetical protein